MLFSFRGIFCTRFVPFLLGLEFDGCLLRHIEAYNMPQEKHTALRKVPSLILSNINNNRIKTQDVSWLSGAKPIRQVESEIVPDSEEDRVQRS